MYTEQFTIIQVQVAMCDCEMDTTEMKVFPSFTMMHIILFVHVCLWLFSVLGLS